MGRRQTDRWIAVCGGVLVNGLILGALVLIEEPAPLLDEPPVIVLELERPERQKPTPKRLSAVAGSPSVAARASPDQPATSERPATATEQASNAPPLSDIDPQWRIDPKTLDRWKLTEGVPAAGLGRYHRACAGLSSEHMTPDEKERCYNGWSDRPTTKRPSPNFVGPIDERHWEVPEPTPPRRTTADEDKRRRRDLCRVVGRMQKANPSGSPLVRQGACP
jgi:hypothetical protein